VSSVNPDLFSILTIWQIAASLILFGLSSVIALYLKNALSSIEIKKNLILNKLHQLLLNPLLCWFFLQWVFVAICQEMNSSGIIPNLIANLLSAWLIFQLLSEFLPKGQLTQKLGTILYFTAGLNSL